MENVNENCQSNEEYANNSDFEGYLTSSKININYKKQMRVEAYEYANTSKGPFSQFSPSRLGDVSQIAAKKRALRYRGPNNFFLWKML